MDLFDVYFFGLYFSDDYNITTVFDEQALKVWHENGKQYFINRRN